MADVDFSVFKDAVRAQFDKMTDGDLLVFRADVSKDDMWDTYLESFPPGTNEVFKERREYDCNCCRQFIKAVGNMVMLTPELDTVTVWDVEVPHPYDVVAKALAEKIRAASIRDVFLHREKSAGVDFSRVELDGQVVRWQHFHARIPKRLVNTNGLDTELSKHRSRRDVLKRGLAELKEAALETVIELTEQNSLYRGAEFLPLVQKFLGLKREYEAVPEEKREAFAWFSAGLVSEAVARIRNSAIGTLLIDLSEDMELDEAVRKYEAVVAPANYKRPTALVTKAMIKRAEDTVAELGYMDAIQRRYAVTEDITVNNVLFADRSAKKLMKNAFEQLADDVGDKVNAKHLEKVEEIPVDKFIETILPKAETIEVLVENKHEPNFMSVIAPMTPNAPNMLKWDNNFSWTYNGEVTDSIKQRVKAAGGSVSGDLRCSLAWHNSDDLDLHLVQPGAPGPRGGKRAGYEIFYGQKVDQKTRGQLDVDMNAGGPTNPTNPVENITFPSRDRMVEGEYRLFVHQYSKRNSDRGGFEVEIEFDGKLWSFAYDKVVRQSENVEVAKFKYTHKDGLQMITSLQEANATREIWGVNTQSYVKCRMVMLSPNHWDDNQVGNRHVFFILEGCLQEGKGRGFYNEFLTDDLRDHRKVFEMLGAKMKAEESDQQLSGLGFSTTKRNSVFLKVGGTFNRTVKVTF
jgi:hypothetical protein